MLYHFIKGKEKYIIIGLPVFPPELLGPDVKQTGDLLLKRLNEPDAFDAPIVFSPKDRMEVVLNNRSEKQKETMEFVFIYKGKKWRIDCSDPFKQKGEYKECLFGELKEL